MEIGGIGIPLKDYIFKEGVCNDKLGTWYLSVI
jgi:hypothetical protein